VKVRNAAAEIAENCDALRQSALDELCRCFAAAGVKAAELAMQPTAASGSVVNQVSISTHAAKAAEEYTLMFLCVCGWYGSTITELLSKCWPV